MAAYIYAQTDAHAALHKIDKFSPNAANE